MTVDKYLHACDASAAAGISGTTLFAAASDEDSVLRVYDRATGGAPLSVLDAVTFLDLDDPAKPETDIEGAAQLGERMYWIGSHGRNKSGKVRKNRQRFFATTVDRAGTAVKLQPAGRPYKDLIADLSAAPALAQFGLAAAAAAELPPEEPGGFNIEGLAPARETGHLLIGFRNPVPQGKALIVRLENPAALVTGTAAAAQLSVGGVLDLEGRGIRALEFVPALDRYLVLAGAFNDAQEFRLYEWAGRPDAPARPLIDHISDLKPEELLVVDATDREITLQLLSDDGTDVCKEAPIAQRSFRGRTMKLQI
jgi:Protein of unknown function (DUF3616)